MSRRCQRSKLLFLFCAAAFIVVNLGKLFFQQYRTIPVIPSKSNSTKQGIDHKKVFMLYPSQLENLPQVISAIIDGKSTGEEPINDIYNNSFAVHPKSRCTRPLGVLVLIKTCYQNKAKRMALRQTWANSKYLSKLDVPIEYAFILGHGTYKSSSEREELMEEMTKEGDVIVANFVDSYRNNTFKSVAGLFWGIQHCKDYEFLLMIDDDIYLNLPNLITFLRHPSSYPKKNNETANGKYAFHNSGNETFWAGLAYGENVQPVRNPASKWFLTWDEYPFKTFPAYFPGGTILYSRNVSLQFALASQFVKYLGVDDVYLGLIGGKLYIKPFPMNNFVLNEGNWKRGDRNQEMNAISIHGLSSPSKLVEFWKKHEHLLLESTNNMNHPE